jgi:secreted PhoX family phosphatase
MNNPNTSNLSRRLFLAQSSAYVAAFAGLKALAEGPGSSLRTSRTVGGYGPLVSDPAGLLDLPARFSYKVISQVGQTMADGLLVPDKADGMGAFAGPDGTTIVVRNHEIQPFDRGPFVDAKRLPEGFDAGALYDRGASRAATAGTTTLVYDTRGQQLVRQWMSLGGTIRNCAGGPTPWGSWISCEETVERAGDNVFESRPFVCTKDHGYNFEVPATTEPQLHRAEPLVAMGRFCHEAVAVDPASGVVYQTEDVDDSAIYRFIPHQPGKLSAGGKLQGLAVVDKPSLDTRNWHATSVRVGDRLPVRWIDLDNPEAPDDDLRYRVYEAGGARFARGEGMWFVDGQIYFACTSGGRQRIGQIWRYRPTSAGGGELELFIEPNDSQLVKNADNLTAAPSGDLVVCEDRDGDEVRIVGVTPRGELYPLAQNHAHTEFAGVCFSPDGSTLFVNLQHVGKTLAIAGPWRG